MKTAAEVLVVGAGIVGAAIAAELAGRGHDVLLVEQGVPGGAVSGASLACIGTHMIDSTELPLLRWACDAWRAFADETANFEYEACGQLRFILDEGDLEVARDWIAIERASGLDVEFLDPAGIRDVEPLLTGPVIAATWSPGDAVVNPFLAVRAFLDRARDGGARLETRCVVEALVERGGRMTGVIANGEEISADHVVLASGPWTGRLAAGLGLDLAVRPRKAQCLATVRLPPAIRRVVGACEGAGGVDAGYTQIQQARCGQVLFNTVLGAGLAAEGTPDEIGEVDLPFVHDSIGMLLKLFPSLEDVSLLRSWVRYEAVTPDDRFLIGPSGPEGLWIAAGDCGTGFIRAPAIARLICGMLEDEEPVFETAIYAPDRFGASR